MSGLKQPILDILTKLTSIQVVNLNRDATPLYARIWNNQLQHMTDGSGYTFHRPACFVEIINSVSFEMMGEGFRNADLGIRLHLIHDFYNQDGTFEQDLEIFDLRDLILSSLKFFIPTACGPLQCVREEQEYDHANTYHYILDFICNFVDSKSSKQDDQNPTEFESIPNPDIDIIVSAGTPPTPTPEVQEFIIPKRNY
jgi:hypothetical protein